MEKQSKHDRLIDKLERIVFGASAQERVDMLVELAARRVEARLAAALASDDDTDGETPDASVEDVNG